MEAFIWHSQEKERKQKGKNSNVNVFEAPRTPHCPLSLSFSHTPILCHTPTHTYTHTHTRTRTRTHTVTHRESSVIDLRFIVFSVNVEQQTKSELMFQVL